MDTRLSYGLLSRTPKFRSPLNINKMKTPKCTNPILAETGNINEINKPSGVTNYIDLNGNYLNDTISERISPIYDWISAKRTGIFG